MALHVQYKSEEFTLLTNWENPYTDGIHGDWRRQVRYALARESNHILLHKKLAKYGPIIFVYSKILENDEVWLKLAGYTKATICVISSSGEHLLTPWMIIHNMGHTLISHNMWIKRDIMKIIGLTSHDDSIIDIQQSLVDCRSSRDMMIPNVNELIYELYTTYIWHGETKSPNADLKSYCDKTFCKLMSDYSGKTFWHKYRHPIRKTQNLQWLEDIVSNLEDVNYAPGVPGFTSKILKARNSSL